MCAKIPHTYNAEIDSLKAQASSTLLYYRTFFHGKPDTHQHGEESYQLPSCPPMLHWL